MKPSLPIDSAIPGLLDSLRKNNCLVLSATPGAGKTTRLPPALLGITDKMVVVLEPRRIAAISAAQRIAEENGWELGREVGYQVRFDSRFSPHTRLLFLTEALLVRKLLRDPDLKQVGCVVLDEFHERSIHVDLALGALKELQALARPDLKIVVMSATLNLKPLQHFLENAPAAEIPGKIYPMEIIYETRSQLLRVGPEFTDRIKKLVARAALENPGQDILCFLPGRGEIERIKNELQASHPHDAIFALHGQLNLQEQKATLARIPGRRKIILSTNVAESSLTVEGVSVVVDSGLARISQMHQRTGFESLDLMRISKASATQRAGRSARNGPGKVYRAWMPYDEISFKEFEVAEILRTDLSETLLLLSALGVSKPSSFSWFEPPPPRALEQAQQFLLALRAIESDGSLSPLGKSLRDLPVHPRLAKLLMLGKQSGLSDFSCELAALLSEPGARSSNSRLDAENDLWLKWEDWKRTPRSPAVGRAAAQLKTLLGSSANSTHSRDGLEKEMPALLLATYPDRLCRRRKAHEPQAKMAGGRGVKLHPDSSVRSSEYFVAIELSEGRDAAETIVYQAVGIPESLLESSLPLKAGKKLEWDETKSRFYTVEARDWNGLSIGREHRRPSEADEIEGALATLAFERFAQVLAGNESLGSWHSRLQFLERLDKKWAMPEEQKIREALEMASYGENSLEKVVQKDLVPYFENLLTEEHRAALARECPSSWKVPSGSNLKIQYSEEQGAQVEVRLQELFGLRSQPKIAGVPLTLILLAPNYRPVQVTRDLESFWKNAYPEVRKEMRARYPKHSWPDDPLTAPPQAKGRPRNPA